MLRKLATVAIVLTFSVGLLVAEEFRVSIRKVDGNKITAIKGQKKDVKGEEVTLTATSNVKVVKGKFNEDTKKLEAGEAIEGGLKNEIFSKINEKKGMGASITTNADGAVTQIIIGGGKKKKDA